SPLDLLPGDEGKELEEHFRAALAGETREYLHPGIRHPSATWRSLIMPLHDAAGAVIGGMVVSRDVEPEIQAVRALERSEEEAAVAGWTAELERRRRERFEFLAEINEVLANCSDRREVMQSIVQAAVPRLGDWCAIHVLLDPADPVPAVEFGHIDPSMVSYARELQERFPFDPDDPSGVPHVIRTGKTELFTDIDDTLLKELQVSEEAVEEVHRLGLRSAITVPVVKRGRVIGAMQFVLSSDERKYGDEDLTLAMAVAGRVAASLDNRRLAERQREIAATLQRSLLPAVLPDIPGAEVAERYWAAGEGNDVGGDFYDVFAVDETSYAVVIGDVCGSGPEAAAVTSLARHNIRANAWRGDDHASVLRDLNFAMLQTWPDTICTVAFGTVTPSGEGIDLTMAVAGHPLPVVVRADGTAERAGRPGLLLGVFDMTYHRSASTRLESGDTLVLFTDGITDIPPPSWMDEETLVAMLADAVSGTSSADEAADAISAACARHVPFERRQDDIALVVLRVGS
ncbi:MAG TPA: SpoIIE family protein phosphatase, partial [Acidimicrobiales bacterium]|nr:SpoIIE family protein phosphatase [Acidimicrobiales bacterium]